MKKKLICGILALGMCFSFASCDKINGILGGILGGDSSENTPLTSSSAEEVNLEEIKEYAELTIRSILSKTSNREDYTLPNTLSYDVYTYNLSWSVNVTEGVQLVKKENGTLVDVDETLSEELKYTLTVTITDIADASKSITTTFNRKVEAAPTLVPLPITKDPVVGTAYKYHIYHAQAQTDYYMTGKIYKTYEYYFDISTKMEDAVDVFVEAVEGESGKFYMYHNGPDGNAKKYINARKTADGKHISNYFEDTAETKWFFDAEVGTMVTVINNLKGVDAKYYVGCDTDPSHKSLSPQAASEDGNKGYLIEMVDRTQATVDQKLEQTAKELSLDVVYVGAGSLDLAKQGSTYPDVTVAWDVKSGDIATIADYKLTVATAPTATTEVVVTATAAVDGKSVKKEFTVKFIPNDVVAILDALDGLKSGESFANKVTLTGIVSAFDDNGEYNEQFGNISITMMVAYNDTYKEVGCYRLNGVGVESVGIGDTITVEGILTNHGGYAKQFGAGSTMTNRVDGEPSDVPGTGEGGGEEGGEGEVDTTNYGTAEAPLTVTELVNATKNYAVDDVSKQVFFVKGEVKSIGEIGDYYKKVYIKDGENEFYIYSINLGDGINGFKVGDVIVAKGYVKNYGGTIEMASNNGTYVYAISVTPGEGGETGGEGGNETPDAGTPATQNTADLNKLTPNTKYDSTTSPDGWKTTNAAILTYGTANTNGYFDIFETEGVNGVCLNGKTTALGSLVSPTFTGGIKKLSFNYGFTFGDNQFSITINVKDANGNVVATQTIEKTELTKSTKYDYVWTLKSAVEGNFSIEIKNNGLSNSSNNKDRLSLWNLAWDSVSKDGASIVPDGGNETPEPTPALNVITAPAVDTAYKFGMVQQNVNNTVYYLAGGMDSYYMATTDDASQALDVYLETTEGGYYLYCYVGNVKTYINCVVNDTHVNGAYEATASTVYTVEESGRLVTTIEETLYAFGTRNDKTYTTIGPVKVSYNGFHCYFYGETNA